jgi:beta-glucanase (GH16 family)
LEAKIKVPKGKAYHAFWLAGERMLPQINIFKYTKKKFYLGHFWGKMNIPNGVSEDQTTVTGAFAGKYHIFSLEWTPKQLKWSINGKDFKISNRGIPSEPMYIAFASGIEHDAQLSNPVKLEIDWVRFYTKA